MNRPGHMHAGSGSYSGTANHFEGRIDALDLSLFAAIDSQSDDGDKRSWLALQRGARRLAPTYCYLEIGSFLGGSIQPHLLDPLCRRIYSIDSRPGEQPDDRGERFRYEDNSTARMLANLTALEPIQAAKVICFDADARDLEVAQFPDRPDLCFIDGEHTNSAVLTDFEFCTRVCTPSAVIYFHDDWVTYTALDEIMRRLAQQRRDFTALKLQGSTFAIALGESPVANDALVRGIARNGRRFVLRRRARRWLERSVPLPIQPLARRLARRLRGDTP